MTTLTLDLQEWDETQVFERVTELLAQKVEAKMAKAIDKQITTSITKLIDARVGEAIGEALERPIYTKHSWDGTPEGDPTSLGEMIKGQAQAVLDERVDCYGKIATDRRSDRKTRLQYLLGEVARKEIDAALKETIAEVGKAVKADMAKRAREAITDRVVSSVLGAAGR